MVLLALRACRLSEAGRERKEGPSSRPKSSIDLIFDIFFHSIIQKAKELNEFVHLLVLRTTVIYIYLGKILRTPLSPMRVVFLSATTGYDKSFYELLGGEREKKNGRIVFAKNCQPMPLFCSVTVRFLFELITDVHTVRDHGAPHLTLVLTLYVEIQLDFFKSNIHPFFLWNIDVWLQEIIWSDIWKFLE